MTISSALKAVREFYEISNPSEEDEFLFTEALGFLIEETHEPRYMMELGGYYYGERRFDLAAKYYELASELNDPDADECLGYIWYYGRTGERNYEKAFYHYSKAAKNGNLVCQYKVADMYKNGYFVEKNYKKYKEIIEDLFPKVQNGRSVFDPIPEVFTRLARIRMEEERYEEAVQLLGYAKFVLAQRISCNAFFGNLNIMKWLVDDLYSLVEFDPEEFDLFDLYFALKKPCKITFEYEDRTQNLLAEEEDGEIAICFNGKWYRTVDDFFGKACIGEERLTSIYDELYDFSLEGE